MTEQEKFDYWLDTAEYDLVTADAMFASGRWLYVVFMCQQAIEKLVKGLYLLYIDDNIPRTHDITAILSHFMETLPQNIDDENCICSEVCPRIIWREGILSTNKR